MFFPSFRSLLAVVASLIPVCLAVAQESNPQTAPFQLIDDAVEQEIAAGNLPGAVVCIGSKNGIVYHKAFGLRSIKPEKQKMELDTVFDLASLTKPIATATSVMLLLEEGKIRLRDPVTRYFPEFGQNDKRSITVQQLLTHVSGLTPDNALADYQQGRDMALTKIFGLRPIWEPGSRFAYSDVGFIVLGEMVDKMTGQPIDKFSHERIFDKLKMNETGFNPPPELRKRSAITRQRGDKWIQGVVHDPRAFEMGGVAGHAGLFSTAKDLSRFCQMLLNQGQAGEVQIISPAAIDVMTRSYTLPGGIKRGLGWDKLSPYSSNRGELMSEQAFGHGGFTGTSMWIDPELDLYVIFLSNRVHPDGKGEVNRLAGRIGTIAAAEISRSKSRRKGFRRPAN